LLPLQTGRSRLGEEADPAFAVLHFPLLCGGVEFDVGGPMDFKPAEFMQRESFSPEALSSSIGFE
jgi:hypothetical protein